MKLAIIYIYGFLFSVVFLISALLWHAQMQEVYFVSHGKGVVADFLPPFVQSGASGDFFIQPPRVVYVIWFVYLACTVVIPGVGAWLIVRLHQHSLNKAWR